MGSHTVSYGRDDDRPAALGYPSRLEVAPTRAVGGWFRSQLPSRSTERDGDYDRNDDYALCYQGSRGEASLWPERDDLAMLVSHFALESACPARN